MGIILNSFFQTEVNDALRCGLTLEICEQSASRLHCTNDCAVLPSRWLFFVTCLFFHFLLFSPLLVSQFCFSLCAHHWKRCNYCRNFNCGRLCPKLWHFLHVGTGSYNFLSVHEYRQVQDSAQTILNPTVIKTIKTNCSPV